MIVPDGDERPARAGVLQVGIGEIAAIDGAIAVERQRNVEIADLLAVGNARDLVDRAVVAGLHLVRIFDDLVDEVAEVQHETELSLRRRALVLEDHPPIGVELAFIDVLAADEGEVHRPRIVGRRRGDRAADAAAVPVRVGEPVPVDVRRLEAADEHAGRPVRRCGDRRRCMRNHAAERLVLGHLDGQNDAALPSSNGRRVHRITLCGSGSPDATPSG